MAAVGESVHLRARGSGRRITHCKKRLRRKKRRDGQWGSGAYLGVGVVEMMHQHDQHPVHVEAA